MGFNYEKARRLLGTASRGKGDALRPIMACHNSNEAEPRACKGYLARDGWSNLNVRLLLAKGKIESPTAVLEACEARGVSLEPDYPAVLSKLLGEKVGA